MCNYKLTVTISKSTDIVDGDGWATGMTWRKTVILEESERADIIALRDLLNGGRPATDDLGYLMGEAYRQGVAQAMSQFGIET